ncbi:MAG: hypothetical protein HW389_771 [Bacteroidetes bacterium]|nr:hypothetical protein [Bacteroidota bacterium]
MNTTDSATTAAIANSLAMISVAVVVLVPSFWRGMVSSLVFLVTVGLMLLIPVWFFAASAVAFLWGHEPLGTLFLVLTAVAEPICMTVLVVISLIVLRMEKKP